jgi:C1A family cysteine protease
MKRYPSSKYLITGIIIVMTYSCRKESPQTSTREPDPPRPPQSETKYTTGWTGQDNPDSVPRAINFASTFSNNNLPSQVDLSPYLPPIGNQGNKGSCVAWATAYYAKTSSEAIMKNYSSGQLNSASFQLSPEYLFDNIPDDQKNPGCNGTMFENAFNVLQQKGVATLATVPYDFNCRPFGTQASWDQDAAHHKIQSFRSLGNTTAQEIKSYLANKYPVLIGAKVSDAFMNWKPSDGVFKNTSMQNAQGHALTIVGYDDAKNAFKIVNSWGKEWGDNGFIWVDYDYLLNSFVFNGNIYILSSEATNPDQEPVTNNTGVDLAPWVFSDVSTLSETSIPNSRDLSFDIYNIGTQEASSSADWSVYYLYYNAYDANDYGIIFQDKFNTSIQANTYACATSNSCTFNLSLPSNSSFAQAAFNSSSVTRSYLVPPLTGYYYLVLMVDPEGKFAEQNKQNNLFYTTTQAPRYFEEGYSGRSGNNSFTFKNHKEARNFNLRKSEFNSAITQQKQNAYTPQEIMSFIKSKVASGEIKRKIDASASSSKKLTCAYCH